MWADIQTEVMEDSAKNFVKETKSLSKKISATSRAPRGSKLP